VAKTHIVWRWSRSPPPRPSARRCPTLQQACSGTKRSACWSPPPWGYPSRNHRHRPARPPVRFGSRRTGDPGSAPARRTGAGKVKTPARGSIVRLPPRGPSGTNWRPPRARRALSTKYSGAILTTATTASSSRAWSRGRIHAGDGAPTPCRRREERSAGSGPRAWRSWGLCGSSGA